MKPLMLVLLAALALPAHAQDSTRVITRWPVVANTDLYEVKWMVGTKTTVRYKTGTADSMYVKRPLTDSTKVAITVSALRRGSPSTSTVYIKKKVAQADSTRLEFYRATGARVVSPLIVEGDSVLAVQRKWFPRGTVRNDTTRYTFEPAVAVRYRALDKHGDSTWIVVQECSTCGPGQYALDLMTGRWLPR